MPQRIGRVKRRTETGPGPDFVFAPPRQIAWKPGTDPDILRKSGTDPDFREEAMQRMIRITCGAFVAVALSACVVVPDRRGPPPPAYGRVEYRAAPPPPQARVEIGFHDRQREMARDYYRHEYHERGRCPPGLAKKHNGCMPPGQARKWRRGEPLPRDVVYRPVPRDLEVRIGPAPRGYRYVEVAGDILMIAVGTSMVVDAIDDLNRR